MVSPAQTDPVHAGAPAAHDRDDRGRGGYLPTLDGWRAVAIALVLVAHAGAFYFSPIGPRPSGRWQAYSQKGGAGVDVFFAISGLLICSRLLNERRSRGGISIRQFYIRRAFRILPPYLTYLLVLCILSLAGRIIVTRGEWISSLLFVRNYLPAVPSSDIGWYTGHFWSLAVEEHFYLLWPMTLVLLPRKAFGLALIVIALAIVWRAIELHTGWLMGELSLQRTDLRIDSLLWGCIAAYALSGGAAGGANGGAPGGATGGPAGGANEGFDRGSHDSHTPPFFRRLSPLTRSRAVWLCAVALAAACFLRDNGLTTALRPALLAFVVLSTVAHPFGIVGRVLEFSPLRWVGRLSYSLYIWQQLFLVSELVPRPLLHGRLRSIPLELAAAFVCAIISYYAIEKPALQLGRRWFPDRQNVSGA